MKIGTREVAVFVLAAFVGLACLYDVRAGVVVSFMFLAALMEDHAHSPHARLADPK